MQDNIFTPASGMLYTSGTVGIAAGHGTISKNLWHGGTGAHAFDANAVNGDPAFVDAANADFHLQETSAAIDAGAAAVSSLVNNDFDIVIARPVGAGFDIGAHEYEKGYVYDRIFADGFE
jgi:hypothetical protein